MKVLKNTTGLDIELDVFGITLLASSSYTVPISEYILLASPEVIAELTILINSGDVVVNDGMNDVLDLTEALDYLRYPNFAKSIRFDNSANDFESQTVQKAIEEIGLEAQITGILQATGASDITTTSTSYTSLDVDITPPEGQYLAILTLEHTSSVSGINNTAEFGVFVAGTVVAESEKTVGVTLSGVSLASVAARSAAVTTCIISVNGSQLVQGGWRRASGTTTHNANQRQLVLIRIA